MGIHLQRIDASVEALSKSFSKTAHSFNQITVTPNKFDDKNGR